jgi:hypothetical protein
MMEASNPSPPDNGQALTPPAAAAGETRTAAASHSGRQGGPKLPRLKKYTYLMVTLDQKEFPETPLGAIPDVAHLSITESDFLERLGEWCNDGGYCPLDDVQLAKALGWRCNNDRARRCRVQCILNGRKVRGVFRPGLVQRGFITVEYDGVNRNGRRLRTTWKWRELFERHRDWPDNGAPPKEEPQSIEPATGNAEAAVADKAASAIAKAAFIAETQHPDSDQGREMAEAIRAHAGFVRPEVLPDAVWTALARGKGFSYVIGCDASERGVNPAEAKTARNKVQAATATRAKAEQAKTRAGSYAQADAETRAQEARSRAAWEQITEAERQQIHDRVAAENPTLKRWPKMLEPLVMAAAEKLVVDRSRPIGQPGDASSPRVASP